jgi:hypothetical protein
LYVQGDSTRAARGPPEARRYGLGLITFALENGMERGLFVRREVRPLAHLLIGAMAKAAMLIAVAGLRQ